ncbi:MAG: hypothetical protein JO209_08335 [Acidisphaera sp.]|nr:hypothetical protein [Acidisphaera sp.]
MLIYSNCQGEELHRLATRIQSLQQRFEFKLILYHALGESEAHWRPYGEAFMRNVDIVWEQIGPDYVEERAEFHARRPAGARVITFPSFSMLSLWPLAGSDPRTRREPRYPDGRYLQPDFVAAELGVDPDILAGSDDAIFQRYMAISAERMPNLDRRLGLDVAKWRQRDSQSDIPVTDFLMDRFRRCQLFHGLDHLTGEPLGVILKGLCERTFAGLADLDRINQDIEAMLEFYVGADYLQTPVHPQVARHFGLEWYDPQATYRYYANEWTYRDYIVRLVRNAPYCQ